MNNTDAKSRIEDFINLGFRNDIYRAETSICIYKTIVEFTPSIYLTHEYIGRFFHTVQNMALVEAILSLCRIYDNQDSNFPNRCIKNFIKTLKATKDNPIPIVEPEMTVEELRCCNFPEFIVEDVQNNEYGKFADHFAHHLEAMYHHNKFADKIVQIKKIRDKAFAHNENTNSPFPINWQDINDLLIFIQNIVGVMGYAYFHTVYMFHGKYELTADAQRLEYSIKQILLDLKVIEKPSLGGAGLICGICI